MRLIHHTYENEELLSRFLDEVSIQPTQSILVQCFESNQSIERIALAIDTLKRLLPNVSLIGTTTAGIVDHAHVRDDALIMSFAIFDHSEVHTYAFKNQDIDRIINTLYRGIQ